MPAKRGDMRKIREVLRLKFEARLSHERIAAATGVSKGAVSNYVQREIQKSLGWPLSEDLDDAALERALFPQVILREQYAPPDYAYVHQELKRKGVTLQLLWEEYHAATASTSGATASSACTTSASATTSPARCGKSTAQGKSCSSTTAARPFR